jgi:Fe-S cluster biogenesis protein NfuA
MSDLHQRVQNALAELLPRMVTDGGGTHIVHIEDNVVTLRFQGNCCLCPSRARSARALKQGICSRVPDVEVRVLNTTVHGTTEEL